MVTAEFITDRNRNSFANGAEEAEFITLLMEGEGKQISEQTLMQFVCLG